MCEEAREESDNRKEKRTVWRKGERERERKGAGTGSLKDHIGVVFLPH